MKIVLNKNDPKSDIIYAALRQAFFKDRHCVVNFSGVDIELDMDSLTTGQTSTELTVEFGNFSPLNVADVVEIKSDAEVEVKNSIEYLEGLRSALGDMSPCPYVGLDHNRVKYNRWVSGFRCGKELSNRHPGKADVEHKVTDHSSTAAEDEWLESLRKERIKPTISADTRDSDHVSVAVWDLIVSPEYLNGLGSALGTRKPNPYVGEDFKSRDYCRWALGFDCGDRLIVQSTLASESGLEDYIDRLIEGVSNDPELADITYRVLASLGVK